MQDSVVAYHSTSTLAAYVFDLEHARTGRKLEGANITQLQRSEQERCNCVKFLLEGYDRSTPSLEVLTRTTYARVRMIDNFLVDDMVEDKHPAQLEDLEIGKVIHVSFDASEPSIHYWGLESKKF